MLKKCAVMNRGIQQTFENYLWHLQTEITAALGAIEGSSFTHDKWTLIQGNLNGRGDTMILKQGDVIEHAGVSVSVVSGEKLPRAASTSQQSADKPFEALGLSLVIHPRNPYVPTTHANVRLIVVKNPDDTEMIDDWWFGGGFDLTPFYIYEDDIIHWHQTAKNACEPFGKDLYARFKKACDEYFYLPHRDETRGVGGIFFEHFNELPADKALEFTESVGNAFLPAYLPILNARRKKTYSQFERDFQAFRRGRYVEFNLLYDRGTHFGLQSGFRPQSIFISMPPTVRYEYDYQPITPKEQLLANYLKPIEWL